MNYYNLPSDFEALRQSYFDSFRNLIAPEYRNISDELLAESLRQTFERLSPEEQQAFAVMSLQNSYENFFKDFGSALGNIGRDIGNALPSIARAVAPVAQIAAPVVGTMIGGPAGTAIGTAFGGLIGNLAGQGSSVTSPKQAGPVNASTPNTISKQPSTLPAIQANPAAAQLMTLLANPQLIQALIGQLMGAMGNTGAVVAKSGQAGTIPFASLMNAISEFAQRAAEESIRNGDAESAEYLIDSRGQYFLNDIGNSGERADFIYRLLTEQSRYASNRTIDNPNRSGDPVTSWLLSAGMLR